MASTPKPYAPKHIAIIGYGALGRATLKMLMTSASAHDAAHLKFSVCDPKGHAVKGWGQKQIRKGLTIAGRADVTVQVQWLEDFDDIIEECDTFYVCVPSNDLRLVLKELQVTRKGVVHVIRTTADPELLNFLDVKPKDNWNLAYVPEFGTDSDLEFVAQKGVDYEQHGYWTNSRQAQQAVEYFWNYLTPYKTFPELALRKLLNNALLASLYAFNNASARLWRQYGVTSTEPLPASEQAQNILSFTKDGMHKLPVSFGGKCMSPSLRMLEVLEGSLKMRTQSLWGHLWDFNEEAAQALRLEASAFIAQKNKKRRRKLDLCMLMGANSHVADESSFNHDCAAFAIAKAAKNMKISPLNPQWARFNTVFGQPHQLPAPFTADYLAAPYVMFLMPVTARVSSCVAMIDANVEMRINSLTVLDPLCQFTKPQINTLKKYASQVKSRWPFELDVVTRFQSFG